MSKRLEYFLESCRSEHTRKIYQYYLDRFMTNNEIKDYDILAGLKPSVLQTMVEDYIMFLKRNVSPNTIPTMIYGIKYSLIHATFSQMAINYLRNYQARFLCSWMSAA